MRSTILWYLEVEKTLLIHWIFAFLKHSQIQAQAPDACLTWLICKAKAETQWPHWKSVDGGQSWCTLFKIETVYPWGHCSWKYIDFSNTMLVWTHLHGPSVVSYEVSLFWESLSVGQQSLREISELLAGWWELWTRPAL